MTGKAPPESNSWHDHKIVGNYTAHTPLGDAIKHLTVGPGAPARRHALHHAPPAIVKEPEMTPKRYSDEAFWHLASVPVHAMPRQVAMAMNGSYRRQGHRNGAPTMLRAHANQKLRSLMPLESQPLNSFKLRHRYHRVNNLH